MKLALDKITFHPLIYPRKIMNEKLQLPFWITTIVHKRAMKSGAKFPPIVVTTIKGIIYLVDGYHRLLAARQLKWTTIDVEFIKCKNFDEAYIQAVMRNNRQGQPLDEYERGMVVRRLHDSRYSLEFIGKVLSMTVADVKAIMVRKIRTNDMGDDIILKSPVVKVGDINGLTDADQKSLSGYSQLHTINELILLIEKDLLDIDNPKIAQSFEKLFYLMRNMMIPARPSAGRRRT